MRNVPKLHVPYYEAGSDSFVDYVMDYTATDNPSTSPSFDVSGLSLKEITFRGEAGSWCSRVPANYRESI